MDSVDSVDPVPGQSRHARRRVLGAGTFGLVTLGLPSASSAASVAGESSPVVQPSAPTGVSGTPIGYYSGGSTGGFRVSWSAVTGATSYQVGYSTSSSGPFSTTLNTVGAETSLDVTGLTSTPTTHYFVVRTNSAGTLSADSSTGSSKNVIALGGTVTSFVGNGTIGVDGTRYVVHSYVGTGSQFFTLYRDIEVEHLIVGGGGSGGSRHGGGGGAGGLLTNVGAATLRTASGSQYSVVVGAGGAGAAQHSNSSPAENFSGSNSSVFGLTAIGGGRGGGSWGGSGGSGGSGGGASLATTPASGTSGQGKDGGSGVSTTGWAGGGGGGAGTAGANATANNGGNGGAGVANTITGSSVTYAGGGGGASDSSSGSGGSGGGGAGNSGGAGTNGTANRGGGGGAGHFNSVTGDNYAGGNGGSGIVVLRYAVPA